MQDRDSAAGPGPPGAIPQAWVGRDNTNSVTFCRCQSEFPRGAPIFQNSLILFSGEAKRSIQSVGSSPRPDSDGFPVRAADRKFRYRGSGLTLESSFRGRMAWISSARNLRTRPQLQVGLDNVSEKVDSVRASCCGAESPLTRRERIRLPAGRLTSAAAVSRPGIRVLRPSPAGPGPNPSLRAPTPTQRGCALVLRPDAVLFAACGESSGSGRLGFSALPDSGGPARPGPVLGSTLGEQVQAYADRAA